MPFRYIVPQDAKKFPGGTPPASGDCDGGSPAGPNVASGAAASEPYWMPSVLLTRTYLKMPALADTALRAGLKMLIYSRVNSAFSPALALSRLRSPILR